MPLELRGKRIEEFSVSELVHLHAQLNEELDAAADDAKNWADYVPIDRDKLGELYAIEDELDRRNERI